MAVGPNHSSRYPYGNRRRNRGVHQRPTCGHKVYHLTCEELGAIERDAQERCAICGDEPAAGLELDHDHAVGARAIRGMVCPPCNGLLRSVDTGKAAPDQRVAGYLATPWYRRASIDGTCPPGCTNGQHRVWLADARERKPVA
jgi:hypothetical protein